MIKCKQHQQKPDCSDSGFTIIESMVALLVAAILLAAIAPVLVLSTATRVQARRIELAGQAAKTFIDGVRSGSITEEPPILTTLSAPSTDSPRNLSSSVGDYLITSMSPPDTSTKKNLYCFNEDRSITKTDPACTSNLFYIQAARIVQSTDVNDGYRLAIRVYRADVDFNKPLIASTTTTKNTQNPFTGGLGDRQSPLVEMTTDIGNMNTSFRALCQRLGVATNKACD